MGIEGEFSPEMHLRLFDGLKPQSEGRLPGMRAVANRQGGWDITFNQEKWLSVLEHVHGDERIGDIRHEARDKAMAYVESEIRVAVRKQSQMEGPKIKGWKYPERVSGNIVWAAFNHPSGRDGSPHGHDHVVVYNASWDATEQQWKKAVTRHIGKREMQHASDIYHKEQARLLRKIGYQVRREGNRLTLPGFPRDVHDVFSERSAAIKGEAEQREARIGKTMSPKARQKVGLFNRPEKETVEYDQRRRGWLSRLTDAQRARLSELVSGAKVSKAMERWHRSLSKHAGLLRRLAVSQESGTPIPERGQKRGGWNR